ASVLLSCGHVICEGCRIDYGVTASLMDKVICRKCASHSDCFMLPTTAAAAVSPIILPSRGAQCALHGECLMYLCTCGQNGTMCPVSILSRV
ncbi:hypothetical protein PFISCL1PPCAC_21520, partial [Pristionchus fissidentatus]